MPFLPRDFPAVHREAGPLRLGDFQRLQILSEPTNELGGVIAGLRRERHNAVVVHPHHFHGVEVHHGGDALDGPGVPVVRRAGAGEIAAQHQPAAIFVLIAVIAGRPRIHHHQAGVGDAPLFDGGPEPGIGLNCGLALHELVEHHAGLHAWDMLPRHDPSLVQGHHRFVGGRAVIIQRHQERVAPDGVARQEVKHHVLVRFPQHNGLEPDLRPKFPLLFQDGRRIGNFLGSKRVKGMRD